MHNLFTLITHVDLNSIYLKSNSSEANNKQVHLVYAKLCGFTALQLPPQSAFVFAYRILIKLASRMSKIKLSITFDQRSTMN